MGQAGAPPDPQREHLPDPRDQRRAEGDPRDDAAHGGSEGTIHGSKASGEPPFMLAFSVREAIRDAVAAFGSGGGEVPLASPATSEAIFTAIRSRST